MSVDGKSRLACSGIRDRIYNSDYGISTPVPDGYVLHGYGIYDDGSVLQKTDRVLMPYEDGWRLMEPVKCLPLSIGCVKRSAFRWCLAEIENDNSIHKR